MAGHNHSHAGEQHSGPLSPDFGHLHAEPRQPAEGKTRRLRWALIITGVVMVVEIVGGIVANSLALLRDAGHMFTHIFALGMAYFAIMLSTRPATPQKTFGYYRAEVLAAFVQDTKHKMPTLQRAVTEGNTKEIELLAHAIEGSALTLKLSRIGVPAGRLKIKATRGDSDGVAMARDLDALQQSFAEVEKFSDELAERPDSAPPAVSPPASRNPGIVNSK